MIAIEEGMDFKLWQSLKQRKDSFQESSTYSISTHASLRLIEQRISIYLVVYFKNLPDIKLKLPHQ